MLNRRRIVALAKCVGGVVIGLTVFWQTAQGVTPHQSAVVVHVMESGVDVTIDDQVFRVAKGADAPISCDLPEGRHELKMWLHGELLYEEEFTLDRDEELILTAWNRTGGRSTIATR